MRNQPGHVGRHAGRSLTLAAIVLLLAAGCGRGEFDGESAYSFLVEQCSFGPRPPGTEAHRRTRDWLVERLRETTDHVALQRFVVTAPGGEFELTNIIASFAPRKRERVLLGTHWDTRAIAERDPDPANRATPIIGANDGASGTAVLLELAHMMALRAPRIGVDLVFFDGEDGGNGGGLGEWCLGSKHYARHLGDYCPSYAVVIDMIGDADLAVHVEPNSATACPEVVERVWGAASRVGATRFDREFGVAVYDDHAPLIRAGIPAALVIDLEYPSWHTVEDTPDKCSPGSLAEIGRVLTELVYGP